MAPTAVGSTPTCSPHGGMIDLPSRSQPLDLYLHGSEGYFARKMREPNPLRSAPSAEANSEIKTKSNQRLGDRNSRPRGSWQSRHVYIYIYHRGPRTEDQRSISNQRDGGDVQNEYAKKIGSVRRSPGCYSFPHRPVAVQRTVPYHFLPIID